MPVLEFENLHEMSAKISILLLSHPDLVLYKPTNYARQNGISRQGVTKRCKNSETLFYLRCASERHVLVVDIVNQ